MDLPVCPNCESVDWSIRAAITVSGYVRRRSREPVDLYADLAPARYEIVYAFNPEVDHGDNQFLCTNCGHGLEASPAANPPLLKEAFDEAFAGTVALHLRDDDTRQVLHNLHDPADPDAWPSVYRTDAAPGIPR